MTKKITEEIYPFGSQYPKVSNIPRHPNPKVSNIVALTKALKSREMRRDLTPKEKALQRSMKIQSKLFGGTHEMKSYKTADKIYAMAIVKECSNLSKEEKLAILEFILNESNVKRIKEVVEEYVEIDEGIFERVEEATKRVKSLFYTKPAGKKDLKFAGKKPLARNRQLSKVLAREGKKLASKDVNPVEKTNKKSPNFFKPYK